MRIMRRRLSFVIFLVVILLFAFVSVSSFSAEYPKEKPIRLIVPYGAGGGVSMAARVLSNSAQELLGQRVDVICMPGAGGQEAVNYVMNQAKDGYTFLVTTHTRVIQPPLTEKMPFEPSDWKPVVQIAEQTPVYFVKEDSPIKDFDYWITKGKVEPNVFSVAPGGNLGGAHLPLVLLEKYAGIENKVVPTNGGAETLSFVLGGHVDIGGSLVGTIEDLVKTGLVRPLVVSSEKRYSEFPDTPTMQEYGYDIALPVWMMVFTYKAIPQDRFEFIENKFIEAMNTEVAQIMAKKLVVFLEPRGSEECQKIYNNTTKSLKTIISEMGLTNQ